MEERSLLILIPARGGSKGLPRKNIRMLGPRSLIGWAAHVVGEAGLDQATCILSTDDAEIAEHAKALGLDVPFLRPPELATDEAGLDAVTEHLLDWLAIHRKFVPDAVLLLQPTSPLRSAATLQRAIVELEDSSVDAVLGVSPLYRTPSTLYRGDAKMNLIPIGGGASRAHRRQEVEPFFVPNGTVFLIRREALLRERTFYAARSRGVVTDKIEALDIDDALDWCLVEAALASRARTETA